MKAKPCSNLIPILALGLLLVAGGCASPPSGTPSPAASRPIVSLPTALPEQISYAEALELFQGGRDGPFDLVERSVSQEETAAVHDVTYAGLYGHRYQANLVIPRGAGPFGAAIYLHGAGGSSTDFLPEALELARGGVAALLITQPELLTAPDPAQAASELVYEIREMDRALALLASRPEIDPDRLGFAGFSFGAVRGATFAGFESGRLRVAILASLPPRYGTPAMAAWDPIAWVPHVSPARLYVQEGTQDTWFSHEEAESLIAAARQPKELHWYESGHSLNEQSYRDRLTWLVSALGPSATIGTWTTTRTLSNTIAGAGIPRAPFRRTSPPNRDSSTSACS